MSACSDGSRPANCPFGVRTDNVEVAPGSVRFALANGRGRTSTLPSTPATMRVTGRLPLRRCHGDHHAKRSRGRHQRLEADRTYTVALTQQPLAIVWS